MTAQIDKKPYTITFYTADGLHFSQTMFAESPDKLPQIIDRALYFHLTPRAFQKLDFGDNIPECYRRYQRLSGAREFDYQELEDTQRPLDLIARRDKTLRECVYYEKLLERIREKVRDEGGE